MEQPESNPTFCTNNCGFYGSPQFEGMCSKCYREHVSRSYNAGRSNTCNSYYSATNSSVTSQNVLQNQVTEDNPSSTIENDNSDNQLQQETDTSHIPSVSSTSSISTESEATIETKNDSSVVENDLLATSPVSVGKKKRNRCSWETCNKKLGLTGFDCRCGGQFCSLHRYANEHNCTFDYKEHGQNEIRKNMPVVQGERVQRI